MPTHINRCQNIRVSKESDMPQLETARILEGVWLAHYTGTQTLVAMQYNSTPNSQYLTTLRWDHGKNTPIMETEYTHDNGRTWSGTASHGHEELYRLLYECAKYGFCNMPKGVIKASLTA